MKFLKNFSEHTINEAKKDKELSENDTKVLDFLKSKREIYTTAGLIKGTGLKIEKLYPILTELESKKLVACIEIKDFTYATSIAKTEKYPNYYSTDILTKDAATEIAKQKEDKSKSDNIERISKKKEETKKLISEKPASRRKKSIK